MSKIKNFSGSSHFHFNPCTMRPVSKSAFQNDFKKNISKMFQKIDSMFQKAFQNIPIKSRWFFSRWGLNFTVNSGILIDFRQSYFQFYLSYKDVWKCERKFRWWIFYFSTKVDLEVNRCWLSLTLKSTKSGPKVTFWTEQGTKISFRAHWRASARAVDIKFEKFRYLGCKTLFEWKHLDQNSLI